MNQTTDSKSMWIVKKTLAKAGITDASEILAVLLDCLGSQHMKVAWGRQDFSLGEQLKDEIGADTRDAVVAGDRWGNGHPKRTERLQCLSNMLNEASEQWSGEVARLRSVGFMDPERMVD